MENKNCIKCNFSLTADNDRQYCMLSEEYVLDNEEAESCECFIEYKGC